MDIAEIVGDQAPVHVTEVEWTRPLRVSAYLGSFQVPDELLVSVRCVVTVERAVVICEDRDGRLSVLPGGRREPGESRIDTVCREVHEETGWDLDPASLEPIGLIHFHNRGDPQPPYPHPDLVHLVLRGEGAHLAGESWVDPEGQVVRSRLVPVLEAEQLLAADGLETAFLTAARIA